jgi:hypothetical protein
MTDIYNLTNISTSYSFYDFAYNINSLTEGLLFIMLLIIIWIIFYVNYQSIDNIMGFYISTFIVTVLAGIGMILGMLNPIIFSGLAVMVLFLSIYVYNKQ